MNKKVPICPKCKKNPCILDDNSQRFLYCESCQMDKRIKNQTEFLKRKANIPPRYKDACFANFPQKVIDAVSEKSNDFYDNILLSGNSDKGKTHLMCAMGMHIINTRRWSVFFIGESELTLVLQKEAMQESSPMMDMVKNVDVLLLDDVGTSKVTTFVNQTFYNVINHRYINQLQTISTTNLKCIGKKIPEMDSRLMWRLISDGAIICMDTNYKGKVRK
jgi:DNA replication protein DnaC